MNFAGKVVLVAGVGGGLGSALVGLLGDAGATIVAVARGTSSLDRLAEAARQRGWKLTTVAADLTSQPEVDRAVADLLETHGRLDGVSVTAGRWIAAGRLLHEVSEQEWNDGLTGNLGPVYRVGRAVLPHFVARRTGSVVLVSASEPVRRLGNPSYCAAKGGILDLTRKLAGDYRPHGVRVNAVLPGNMAHDVDPLRSPALDRPAPLTDDPETSPWEVARAIGYLLSEESRWVTGALLTVDGGLSTPGASRP